MVGRDPAGAPMTSSTVDVGVVAPGSAHGRLRIGAGPLFVGVILVAWVAGFAGGMRWSVAMLALFGFTAAVAGLRRPRIGLLAIGLLCSIEPLMNDLIFTGGILRWNTFNYWLAFVAMLGTPLLLRRNDVSLRLIQLVALTLAVGLVYSLDRPRGIQDLLALSAIFGLVVYLSRGGVSRSDWYWLGVVCGTAAALTGFHYFRDESLLVQVNPNSFVYLPLTALFALCLALPFAWERRRGATIVAALAGACAVWIFLSGSRGGMVLALVSGLYFVVGMRGLRRRAVFLSVTALLALAGATLFADIQRHAIERVNLLFDRNVAFTDRTSSRSALMLRGWYLFVEDPLGVGTGGFTEAARRARPRPGLPSAASMEGKPAHSGWVKVLVENGAFGFLLVAAFFTSFAATAFRRRVRSVRAIGFFTTVVLCLAFLTTEYASKGIWFLAAAAIVLLRPRSPLAIAPQVRR